MKHLALLPLMLGLISVPSALALSARTISTEQAQGTHGSIVTLEVAPGYGLNINLIPIGEIVKKAWIDDPSRIVLSFDGNLCQSSGERECNNEGATVIHLRQIKPIAFPGLPRSPSGGTLLTLITEGGSQGRKIYQFKVVPVSGQPKYTVLSISPDVEQVFPALPPVRRNLPIVQAPVQPLATSDGQWQAQTPITSVRQNDNSNVVKLSPTINSTTPPVATQQLSQNSNSNAVSTNPVIATTPKTALTLTPKPSPSSTTDRSQKNAIAQARTQGFALWQQPTSNSFSSPPPRQEKKVTAASFTPSTKLTNNSRTPSSKTDNNTNKLPKRATLSSTTTNNLMSRAISKPIASSTTEDQKSNGSIEQANALVRGLVIARQKGQINHGTTTWKKVQSVVRLLRRGDTKQEAATKVRVSLQLIERLLEWGSGSTVATINSSNN